MPQASTEFIFILTNGIIFHDTGNLDTLEVRPRAKGLDTRNELIKFYKDHYSANLMHLVVYSKGWFIFWFLNI